MTAICTSAAEAVGDVADGSTVLVSGRHQLELEATAVVQVRHIVETGALDPEAVVTPSIVVDRVIAVGAAT